MHIDAMTSAVSSPQQIQRQVESPATGQPAGASFGEQLSQAVEHINGLQQNASNLVEQVATGQIENVHQAMIAMEQASLSFNFGLQVRNKVLDAYQEIMRTQI